MVDQGDRRDELPLSHDLGSAIQDALAASRYLIVICSPDAAKSQWVNEEVKHFRAIGREDRILALIAHGTPNATDLPGRASEPVLNHDPEFGAARYTWWYDDRGLLSDTRCFGPDGEPIAGAQGVGREVRHYSAATRQLIEVIHFDAEGGRLPGSDESGD